MISIAAMYEKEDRIENWNYKPDFIATQIEDVLSIAEQINNAGLPTKKIN